MLKGKGYYKCIKCGSDEYEIVKMDGEYYVLCTGCRHIGNVKYEYGLVSTVSIFAIIILIVFFFIYGCAQMDPKAGETRQDAADRFFGKGGIYLSTEDGDEVLIPTRESECLGGCKILPPHIYGKCIDYCKE